MMANIRGHGNRSTELRLVAIFRKNAIAGWRRHQKVAGKPDFVFRKQHVAVFVDGCFWHGCPKCYQKPGGNKKFWAGKLTENRRRDRVVTSTLRKAGWKVARFWECLLRREKMVVGKIRKFV